MLTSWLLPVCILGVVTGEDASGKFPDCVAVAARGDQWCASGVVVGSNLVLTAGYVGAMKPTKIRIGKDWKKGERDIEVKHVIMHPRFEREGTNDLCLLVLKTPADINPLPFASREQVDRAKSIRVVGFGAADVAGANVGVKRFADIRVLTARCAIADEQKSHGCHSGELVAADADGKDAAGGDGGGPAYIQVDQNKWRIAAITNRASSENVLQIAGKGGIYTRLDNQLEWIKSVARQHGSRLAPE